MEFIKQRRLELGLSQAELGALIEVSKQRVAQIECGRDIPTAILARRVEAALGMEGVPATCHLADAKFLRRLTHRRPYALPTVPQGAWMRMERYWPYPLKRLNVSAATMAWLKRFCRCDEASESLGLVQFAAAGARPMLANPHQLGFRDQTVVDEQGLALGERVLPCLHWVQPDFECILWPQVSLRPLAVGYRVDYLILLRKRNRVFWLYLELDGKDHDEDHDLHRQSELKLYTIRIPALEVRKFRLVALVSERLKVYPKRLA